MKTLAQNIVHRNEKKTTTKTIAIRHENCLKLSGHEVAVEPCGFVIDKNNFVLGATPDGKVAVDGEFGLLEVKCSEE